jgi:diguanylate cyclase (GGDEF)-like protein
VVTVGTEDRSAVLHESTRTRIVRIADPDGTGSVIRKELRGPDAVQRSRRERTILERLAGVDGVPQLVDLPCAENELVLRDNGDRTLAAEIVREPLSVPDLLALAVGLADIIAAVHRRGVVHKDINPANVMIVADRPVLIDFELSTTAAEERPGFTHQSQITGTLAYLAPEQTGRTGRPVDQRSDLYAFGATLYELATGRPPFGNGDPLHLLHDHLARRPDPPAGLNPELPGMLCEIIERLLEKEPDRRYQSAEGCAYDLARVGAGAPMELGERDFPARLVPPSRLVGRAADIAWLRRSFDDAVAGVGRGMLVSGLSGVGKTVLIDELRPIVTAAGGWFVTGKFDQYRQDLSADAVAQACRGLGRLLLAEPDAELARLRAVALPVLGSNAALLSALIPEFGTLLDVPPEDVQGEPTEVQARLFQAALALLRVVVSPGRPLVMVIDDLQWGGATPVALIELLLMDEDLPGLLMVAAYREEEVDAAHPLTAVLSRWERLDSPPRTLRLRNLPPEDLSTLLAEMLRMPVQRAAGLAEAIAARTAGNPFDTVELVNGLRRDGALAATEDGWAWDADTVRRWVGDGDVGELIAARIERQPRRSRQLLTVIATLGGETDLDLLGAAAAASGSDIETRLAPALEDGLIVLQDGADVVQRSVRFRHDRVQYAAYHRITPRAQQLIHLVLARRLAADAGYASVAAQQYLPATDLIGDRAERQRVAELFRTTAARLKLINYAMAEQYLSAAIRLVGTGAEALSPALLAELRADRHRALYNLGRLAEADEVYAVIAERPDPVDLADSAGVQIASLTVRGMPHQAIALGMDVLRRLGVPAPHAAELESEVDAGLDRLRAWTAEARVPDDVGRADISDPPTLAASQIILRMMPPSFFAAQTTMAWLVTAAQRIWVEHGPGPALIGTLAHAGIAATLLREDYETGYRVLRHVEAVGDARGWAVETAVVRFLASACTSHWFEPVENSIDLARRAHESLVHGGDLAFACFTFHTTVPALIDCAPTLSDYQLELAAAAAFTTRVGNEQNAAIVAVFETFVRSLQDGPSAATAVPDLSGNPMAAAYLHTTRALTGAIFGADEVLIEQAGAAGAMLPYIVGNYFTATAQLLRAFALATRARTAPPPDGVLAELDEVREWLAARAVSAPANFRHLVHFIDAERAWAVGDPAAGPAFDAALREVARRRRPWHHAFIAERAARFHLEHDMEYIGHRLLQDAYQSYLDWGATVKVRALERQFPFLRDCRPVVSAPDASRSTSLATEAVDLMAVVKASQALSSETNLDNLRHRVIEILGALTGATAVDLLTRGDSGADWALPLGAEASAERIPLAILRYAERTREPLLIDDATSDARFARDPYLSGLEVCSVLAVTIMSQGEPRAMLLLQNTLWRGTFTRDRLDAVMLIAGQLAVSMENALLYASLEHKVAERTEQLRLANDQLEIISRTDPLTGLANRRRLAGWLEQAWCDGADATEPLAFAMIDIDHFKLYNDHYGHLAGDACLELVARTLSQAVRDGDMVARYGGEEFAVVLPRTDRATAHAVGERIQQAVAALAEKHATAAAEIVTVSVGVAAEVPGAGRAVEDLLADADTHLYEAKQRGRNRVVS